ncbi:hypothetical protein HK097_005512, partial [Rhizophlyctis rosea]
MAQETFRVETLPWKSKRCPRTPPHPLPQTVQELCWGLVARRMSGKTLKLINIVRAFKRSVDLIYILSPIVRLDQKWRAVTGYDNVIVSSKVDNETLAAIVEVQQERYDPKHPDEYQALVIIDDAGCDMRRAKLRQMINDYTSRLRHFGAGVVLAVQSINHLEGSMITNITQWSIWDMNKRALKKFCDDVATARVNEDTLKRFILENTGDPYAFVCIDFTKPPSETLRVGFDRVWTP